MKVFISKYRYHWLSPYTILEKVLFWKDWDNIDYDEPWVTKWVDRIHPFSSALLKVLDIIHPKINYVKIDKHDTWSMDMTLAYIILPMLKQLKDTKHGAPFVDDSDVPDELKSTSAPPKANEWDVDDNHFKRWDWVMDEMIFAFSTKLDDSWQDKFYSGKLDIKWTPVDNNGNEVPKNKATSFRMDKGPNDTFVKDQEGIDAVHNRITNGFRLFGKYYEGLWD